MGTNQMFCNSVNLPQITRVKDRERILRIFFEEYKKARPTRFFQSICTKREHSKIGTVRIHTFSCKIKTIRSMSQVIEN